MGMVMQEQEIRQWYERYVRQFHRDDVEFMQNINLKYDHTERVVIESRGIAISLGLNPDEMTIVQLSAMLHDVGRYPQLEKYNTFDDRNSVNHAQLGSAIIAEQLVLKKLNRRDQNVILTVVGNHNSKDISSSLSEEVASYLRIIRDGDKLDIWRTLAAHYTQSEREQNRTIDLHLPEGDSVHPEIIKDLEEEKNVRKEFVTNRTELKLLQLSWVYNLNYLWSFQVIEKRKFLHDIISTLPESDTLDALMSSLLRYVEHRAETAKESGLRGR